MDNAKNDVWIIPKILDKHIKTLKVKNYDKNKNNKLIFFLIDDDKLLGQYKTIWSKTLPASDNRYIKARTYATKFILTYVA